MSRTAQFRQTRPKWKHLYETLRANIINETYPRGYALPAQNKLARDCGVSLTTAREAVTALVQEGLLVKVHGKGTFVAEKITPDSAVIEVFTPCHRTTPNINTREVVEILAGIGRAAKELNISIRLHRVPTLSNERIDKDVESALEDTKGAIILKDVPDSFKYICRHRNVPFVMADAQVLSNEFPQVSYDRREAARLATQHLYDLGHRRIAFIGANTDIIAGAQRMTELQRGQGFLDVVRTRQLDLPAGYLIQCEKNFSVLRSVTRKLLETRPRPTAICCSTDRIASAVITVLLEEDIDVPKDIALIACTNAPNSADQPIPLSGVDQPFETIGFYAASLLRKIIDGKELPPMPMLIPTCLVIRDSCGGKKKQSFETTKMKS